MPQLFDLPLHFVAGFSLVLCGMPQLCDLLLHFVQRFPLVLKGMPQLCDLLLHCVRSPFKGQQGVDNNHESVGLNRTTTIDLLPLQQ